ncbi:MAG: hypothetical protein ACTS8P_06530 [Arsenophonus sp. NC-XBC3-MAG3]
MKFRCKKAAECDELPAEVLKALALVAIGKVAIDRLTKLMNKIYRTKSLISHTANVLTRIILNRINRRLERMLDDKQFGFRKGRGTRDAIGCMRILIERVIDLDKDLYHCHD